MADRAENRSVDLQLAGRSERRLGEGDVEPDQRVLPAAYPRTRPATARAARRTGPCPAKERVHDVGEREPRPRAGTAEPRTVERVAAEVVHPALLRVGEHLVSPGHVLEPLLRRRIRVHVRVQLSGELAIRLLDRVAVRLPGHTEGLVQVLAHYSAHPSSRIRET